MNDETHFQDDVTITYLKRDNFGKRPIHPYTVKMNNKLPATVILAILLSVSTVNFGQAPDLGTSSSFALFASTGSFSNTGPTTITGDLGANVGPITGFPPGTVTGSTYLTDAVSAQATVDVQAAYDALSATTCQTTLLAPLGNGQTLAPGVYCLGTASTLDGSLILDGGGDANALFIIKITGTLTTGILSRVVTTNSASLQNVYWQIDGQLTLGDNSIFRGTAIVNGVIQLSDGATLFGRGLSRQGAISLVNNIAAVTEPPPLAIKLSAIDATNEGARNRISWVTESESDGDFVELERSDDGNPFALIGIIPGNGQPSSYIYWDLHPFTGLNLYRLKMKEISGNFTYSRTVTAVMKASDQYTIEVYPNPAKDWISVIINGTAGNNMITMSDLGGKQVRQVTARNNKTDINIADLPTGIYFIKYFDGMHSQVIKMIKR